MAMNDFFRKHPVMKPFEREIRLSCGIMLSAFRRGNQLLLAGNGGSASDCEHMSGELLKDFMRKRPLPRTFQKALKARFGRDGSELAATLQEGYPAIPLSSFTAFNTAFGNDARFDMCFAQLVRALGRKGDVLVCFSTTGNSRNQVLAAQTARVMGLKVVGFLGRGGGRLKPLCDASMVLPGDSSYSVQEWHLPVYHAICLELEERLAKKGSRS
jgi:phosphoheptose isomerase